MDVRLGAILRGYRHLAASQGSAFGADANIHYAKGLHTQGQADSGHIVIYIPTLVSKGVSSWRMYLAH